MTHPPHNLPAQPTPLIGREREVRAVRALLSRAEARVVTLTGPGGTGKTRVGLQVAAEVADEFADGVAFVGLAPIGDPGLLASSIAQALGLRETAGRLLLNDVVAYLRDRCLLLVLDNFEQLLPAGPLVAELLAACPRLKVLVTSRAALRLSGEHEYPVPPLALPDPTRPLDAETLVRYESAALFVQRAQAVRPDFEVTDADAGALSALCARLDGLPLAIELAAARIKLLSPQALLARLDRRLNLLTGGARDLPARQQTLRGTIDWSYHLLEPAERAMFARLAVFAGGCTLEAVEAVCCPDAQHSLEALDRLGALVDQSLLRRVEGPAGEPRFSLLETIREYAVERLEASGEAETWRGRHAQYYLALAKQVQPELLGPEQGLWLDRLEREHDNLRAALGWAIERDEATVGLQLPAAMLRFWEVRGHFSEGQSWLERALARWPDAPSPDRAGALNALGILAYDRGDFGRAIALHEESLRLRRAIGDHRGIATSLHNLGIAALQAGDRARSEALNAESLTIQRELDDKQNLALSLNSAGILARSRGDSERARALYEECLALLRELGDVLRVGLVLNNLARVMRDLGDWERAIALCTESLAIYRRHGDRHGVAAVMTNLSVIAQRRGALEQGAQLYGAAEGLRESLGAAVLNLSPFERSAYATAVAALRAGLGEDAFNAAVSAGRALPPEEVAEAALADFPPNATAERRDGPPAPPPQATREPAPGSLTRREREVARLVAQGLTDRQVAEALVITEGTVGVHLSNIFTKLDLRSRAQLAAWVARHDG